ncbi:Odorant receptor 26, partial [Halyomorpha halys]
MEGEAKPNLVDRDVLYNFEQERELLMMISCYKVSKSSKLNHFLSLSYVSIVWLFVLFELCMGLYSVVLTIDSPKTQLLETLHTVVLTFYVIAHMTNRLQSGFDAALEIINKGFYTYDENMGETHYEIRKEYVRRIRLVNKWFRIIIIYSGISFLMFNTAKKYLENVYKTEPSKIPINPYFPIPYFMPFDTSTVVTFTSAYLLNVALEFFICSVTICIDEIYVSLIEQLKAQFVILNLSISNIVERALRRYQDGKAGSVPNVEELYQQKEFQDCVLQCLKENIRHHHALLRFTALIRNYVQRTFFLVVITGGLALALAVLVITK